MWNVLRWQRKHIWTTHRRCASTVRPETLTGGQIIHQLIKLHGVKQVFGYSGGAVLPLVDAFVDSDIKWYTSSHEQCSGHSAAAAAKTTGLPGVCIVTSGPGVTNLVTPLQDAMTDGVPLVLLSGQVPTSAMGTDAFQECPATEITRSCTKWNFVCHNFQQLPWAINEAFRISMTGRPGPVHVDLPKDVLSASGVIPPSVFEHASRKAFLDDPPVVDVACIEAAIKMINNAQRPILYVGQGANNCPELVNQMAQTGQIPVTTTLHGMGIFDELDDLSLHMIGMHGAAYANFAIQKADVIVAIGSRFDDRTTGIISKYAPAARQAEAEGRGGIIHLDIRRDVFGKIVTPTIAVPGDCATTLSAIAPLIRAPESAERRDWVEECKQLKRDHAFGYVPAPHSKIKTQGVIEEFNTYLSENPDQDTIVCTGVGNHQMMAAQFLRWRRPRSMVTSGSLGVMGAGLPFAIGAAVANPDKRVLLIDGDGSFGMTNMDLQTVKRYQIPLKMAVFNDGRQQMVYMWQKLFFNERFLSVDCCNPDFEKLAEAYGIEVITCDNVHELPDAVERFMSAKGPILGNFVVQPDVCLPMVAPGKALDEMILLADRSRIMQDEDGEDAESSRQEKIVFEGLAPC